MTGAGRRVIAPTRGGGWPADPARARAETPAPEPPTGGPDQVGKELAKRLGKRSRNRPRPGRGPGAGRARQMMQRTEHERKQMGKRQPAPNPGGGQGNPGNDPPGGVEPGGGRPFTTRRVVKFF